MRKLLIVAFLTLILSPVTLGENAFWKEKKSTQWSRKEVIRMMTKSPWSQRIAFSLPGSWSAMGRRRAGEADTQLRDPRRMPVQTGPFLMGRATGRPQDTRRLAITPSTTPDSDKNARIHLHLTVRWYALPLRHARDRWEELWSSEKNSRKNRQKVVAYVIGISGLPARSLAGDVERLKAVFDQVKTDSFLKVKGRDPIVSSGLWIPTSAGAVNLRSAPWRSGGEFYLLFPRDKKDGYIITLEDKKVEFVTRIGSLEVKRKFKLKDMVYNGKLEL